MLCLNFEVARQVGICSLCGYVQTVPKADEVREELSRLAPSLWKLSQAVSTFRGAVPWQESRRDLVVMFEI